MKNIEKFKDKARNPKVRLALGLTVATISYLAPHDSKSYSYCSTGHNGDCVLITDGNMHCSAGSFWNDCT